MTTMTMTTMTTKASGTPPAAKAARTRRLLEGAIVPTLLTLAAPNILNLVALTVIVTADAFFVGWLGATALAGVTLVFPLKMLMQHMAASGMGGAVTSAIARALGAGRRDQANALAVHALCIATAMAALFSTVLLAWGPEMYAALGGRGEVLDTALTYSTVIFAGAITPWLFNTLASIVRGTGNMTLPAAAIAGSAFADLLLSPALLFGWGPFPRLGIAGAGIGFVTSFGLGSLVLGGYLLSGRSLVKPSLSGFKLEAAHLAAILRVGVPGSVNVTATNVTVALVTGLVAPLGAATLAGYGVAARIEYVLIPLVFGFGTSLVTMVATNVGAGQRERAERIAWIGAGVVMAFTGTIGLVAAILPHLWMGPFTTDADVLAAGSAYLRLVGPAYGLYGFGAALYFGSQGFGRLMWPVLANVVRLAIAAGGGWLVTRWLGGGMHALFTTIAAAFVIYSAITFAAIRAGAWRQ
jgi:MATE family, multidrug efflux pump